MTARNEVMKRLRARRRRQIDVEMKGGPNDRRIKVCVEKDDEQPGQVQGTP